MIVDDPEMIEAADQRPQLEVRFDGRQALALMGLIELALWANHNGLGDGMPGAVRRMGENFAGHLRAHLAKAGGKLAFLMGLCELEATKGEPREKRKAALAVESYGKPPRLGVVTIGGRAGLGLSVELDAIDCRRVGAALFQVADTIEAAAAGAGDEASRH